MLLVLVKIYKFSIRQFDEKAAYLYGDIKEKVYMEQPPEFENGRSEVCELEKGIYGLPQSGRSWNEKLNEVLLKLGLERVKEDPCLYMREKNGKRVIIRVYVDDLLMLGTDDESIETIVNEITCYFILTETRDKNFLNIKIEETEGRIELSQELYIDTILDKYGLLNCNNVKIPLEVQQNLDEYEDSPKVNQTKFQMIGSLMYLSVGTRPNITHAVSMISQYNNDPRQIHLIDLKCIFRYLKGTKKYKLVYKNVKEDLTISTDASWNATKDAKAYEGYTVKLGSNLISWKSKKQTLIALSTCETKLISLCEGVQELKWIQGLLNSLKLEVGKKLPIEVKTDSKAAID